ncbi:MAG TPA: 2-C-methyl-D-erythritol 4-phosphate cytidylyltransferase [Candidatus Eremiobacteraceae bacterium]|nr:2-C-methyl-D-erythritol 4-phosphate cytidylyltransferase [Candidatus Eremiobacteraceae bacterium]
MSVAAILAAAGRGDRLGRPKQLLDLAGKPMAAWSLEVFEDTPAIDAVYIACEADERERFEALAKDYAPSKKCVIVAGGATRQASVHAALSAVAPAPQLVLVHDGARPFVTPDIVERTIAAAHQGISAIAAVPVKDTIKQAHDSAVARTIPRATLWAAQTPQVFPYDVLVAAHARALADGVWETDDAALVERLGAPVVLVMGSYANIKITTPEDFEIALWIAQRMETARR